MNKNPKKRPARRKTAPTKRASPKLNECELCFFSTDSKENLTEHIRNIHKELEGELDEKIKYLCEICSFKTYSHSQFQNHRCFKEVYDVVEMALSDAEEECAEEKKAAFFIEQVCSNCKFKTQSGQELINHKCANEMGKDGCKKEEKGGDVEIVMEQSCDDCGFATYSLEEFLEHECARESEVKPALMRCQDGGQDGGLVTLNESGRAEDISKVPDSKQEVPNDDEETLAENCKVEEEILLIVRDDYKDGNEVELDESYEDDGEVAEVIEIQIEPERSSNANFLCPHCPFKAKTQRDLNRHLISRHTRDEDIQWHQCSECDFKTKLDYALKNHMLIHIKAGTGRWFTCKECPYKTRYKHNYGKHMLVHTPDEDIDWAVCDQCGSRFKDSMHLKRHIKKLHCRPLKECEFCSFKTYSQKLLWDHAKEHAKDKSCWYYCDQCLYKSPQKGLWRKHVQLNHTPADQIKWFPCELCPYKSKSNSKVKRHVLLKHTPAKLHKCEKCPFKTNLAYYLRQHMLRHVKAEDATWFKCEACEYKTKYRGHYNMHAKSAHQDLTTWYQCELCSFKTKSKTYMPSHMLTHQSSEEIVWYQCDQCEHLAKRKTDLKYHVLTKHPNEDDEVFLCDRCPYQTTIKGDFKKHFLVHHPAKAQWLTCSECSYSTKFKAALNKHVLFKHTADVEMLPCEHCEYRTKVKGDLKKHVLLRHTREEDVTWFACSQCSYKSKIKSDLNKHVSKQHVADDQLLWYGCEECPYKAKRKGDLKKHFLLKHTVTVEWYSCELCEYKAKLKSDLKKHVLHKHVRGEEYEEFIIV